MGAFFILTNLALTIIVGAGIYSFSESWIWAIVGALVITGSASANPIFALLAYPAIEYFFNNGQLTMYSALSVGINVTQMAFIYLIVKNENS